jgi:hypothetical protein
VRTKHAHCISVRMKNHIERVRPTTP